MISRTAGLAATLAFLAAPVAAQQLPPESLPPLPATTPIVSQGEVALTLADIDAFAASIPSTERAQVFDNPRRIEDILRGLLASEQLAQQALADHLDEDSRVKAELANVRMRVLATARTRAVREKFESEVPDLGELARERYQADPDKYTIPRRVDVRHILIKSDERGAEAAEALAKELAERLQANPDEFQKLVDEYSEDPSKERNHGLITDAASGRTARPFSEASAGLSFPGEIVGPVRTQFGYHLIRAESITSARQRSFDEVSEQILTQLRADWVAEQVRTYVDELRSAKLDANPEAVASLRTRYLHDVLGEADEDLGD